MVPSLASFSRPRTDPSGRLAVQILELGRGDGQLLPREPELANRAGGVAEPVEEAREALLEEAVSLFPETVVIIMTGFGSIQSAVEAMSKGAYWYFAKPFQLADLVIRGNRRVGRKRGFDRHNPQL